MHGAVAFSGEGARRYGGRCWNPKGRAAVYTASSLSLAALEILVHADSDLLGNEFLAFAVDIPEDLAVERLELSGLPASWREEYPPLACRGLGGAWLERGGSAVLAVPSAVVPVETNYLLNPDHADFARLRIQAPTVFQFDARLWQREHRHFMLNAEEWRRFTATLDQTPEPNETLRTAWRDDHDAALNPEATGTP